jgi:predicted GH43/DUF377 family glycosyl hydrolase
LLLLAFLALLFAAVYLVLTALRTRGPRVVHIHRYAGNPIISPRREHGWESEGAFNAAAVLIDGVVHFLYRAIGKDGSSSFGYALSRNGYDIHERHPYPAYVARRGFEGVHERPRGFSYHFGSGGGWGGCEDPKLTLIDETVYLTYVAHPGYWPPRTAISSIYKGDFVARRFEKWSEPALMSPPNIDSKSAVLMPERIFGKYVIFHRVWPDIVIDFVDDLDFYSDEKWLHPTVKIRVRPDEWDNHKISMGAAPVKTDKGWLVIYGAIDRRDFGNYKVGAMLLSLNDPGEVLYRTKTPILKPETPYENDWKPGIVYPSGVVLKDGTLFMYYGGGDKYTALATAPIDVFLNELIEEGAVRREIFTW